MLHLIIGLLVYIAVLATLLWLRGRPRHHPNMSKVHSIEIVEGQPVPRDDHLPRPHYDHKRGRDCK